MSDQSQVSMRRVCSVCDYLVTDPHIHNVWRFYHPLEIEQRPTTGLNLEPANFAVITYSGWIDMNMQPDFYPRVGLS